MINASKEELNNLRNRVNPVKNTEEMKHTPKPDTTKAELKKRRDDILFAQELDDIMNDKF